MVSKFNSHFFLLLLISLSTTLTHGAKVLFLATNIAYSHMQFTGKLADILVDAGHDVDYVIETLHRGIRHNGTQKANIIRFENRFAPEMEKLLAKMAFNIDAFEANWDNNQMKLLGEMFELHCDGILSDKQFLNTLRSKQYTIGMAENFDPCAWAIFRHLGIKSVHELSALPIAENTAFVHGFPFDFRRIPGIQNYHQQGPIRSFTDMLYNFYEYLNSRFNSHHLKFGKANQVFKRLLGANHPTFAEMQRDSSYIWINTHELADFARAKSPKIKHIGGIAIKEPEVMSEEAQKIYKIAKKGVVLLSLGSIVDTSHIKPKIRDNILKAFARFPDYEFIWKMTKVDGNTTALLQPYSNVHAFTWIQQTALLAHPKTRAIISPMGLNSLNEAVAFGVPIVAIPLVTDHYLNTATAVHHGIAYQLNRKGITTESLTHALREVLENESYRKRSLNLKAKIANLPYKPADVFVKHVEFSEKFGALEELKLDTVNDSIFVEFHLDLIALSIFVLIFAFYLIKLVGRLTLMLFIGNGSDVVVELEKKKVN